MAALPTRAVCRGCQGSRARRRVPEPAADADRHDDFGPDADAACCAVHAAPALSNRNAYAVSHCNADSNGNTTPIADASPHRNAVADSNSSTACGQG